MNNPSRGVRSSTVESCGVNGIHKSFPVLPCRTLIPALLDIRPPHFAHIADPLPRAEAQLEDQQRAAIGPLPVGLDQIYWPAFQPHVFTFRSECANYILISPTAKALHVETTFYQPFLVIQRTLQVNV